MSTAGDHWTGNALPDYIGECFSPLVTQDSAMRGVDLTKGASKGFTTESKSTEKYEHNRLRKSVTVPCNVLGETLPLLKQLTAFSARFLSAQQGEYFEIICLQFHLCTVSIPACQ